MHDMALFSCRSLCFAPVNRLMYGRFGLQVVEVQEVVGNATSTEIDCRLIMTHVHIGGHYIGVLNVDGHPCSDKCVAHVSFQCACILSVMSLCCDMCAVSLCCVIYVMSLCWVCVMSLCCVIYVMSLCCVIYLMSFCWVCVMSLC